MAARALALYVSKVCRYVRAAYIGRTGRCRARRVGATGAPAGLWGQVDSAQQQTRGGAYFVLILRA